MSVGLGVRRVVQKKDGRLGDQFVLLPRLAAPSELPNAKYSATYEALRTYLLLRYRQTGERILTITRATALEKSGITTPNVTRAMHSLMHALEKLVADGTLESYTPVPRKAN